MSQTTSVSTRSGMVARITQPQSPFSFAKVDYSSPRDNQVLIKVAACGVCHSDSFALQGTFPGIKYPVVPGHEIAGTVEAVGPEVARLKPGDRVGVGWHGGHCGHCLSCRSGDFISCESLQIPGINRDGGYAQYAIFSENVCASVPDELNDFDAGPLLCAGVTTFNALRNSGARAGDTVAILGVGGLGHLGVQFAKKMGYFTIAIARGSDKAAFAGKLGADRYIDSNAENAVESLKASGGANLILATATSSKAMSPWIDALSIGGKLLIVGADIESLNATPIQLLSGRRQIVGWPSGTAKDSEDCLRFSARFGIRPMIEKYPFDRAAEAVERMLSGKARFRVVIDLSAK